MDETLGDTPHARSLTTRGETEVSEAIQACVVRCMGQADPVACAKRYGSELVAAGWTPLDARQVEIGAMRVIANTVNNGPRRLKRDVRKTNGMSRFVVAPPTTARNVPVKRYLIRKRSAPRTI